ncbi:hypothetical protein PVAG01_02542 [Phlyctema vagabunda]|uniref:BZIP domain-containing protein n=1 Tax=Phlyctema vagabunda TaxID=108571 RepID=A0ABR4PS74_9HELO
MPTASKKKVDAQHTLTRVRNNQRRCRERKREYVAELEKRIQALEAAQLPPGSAGLDENTEAIQTAHHLKDENRKLRALLATAGFNEEGIEAYLKDEIASEEQNLARDNFENLNTTLSDKSGEFSTLKPPTRLLTIAPTPDLYSASNTTPSTTTFNFPFLSPQAEQFNLIDSSLQIQTIDNSQPSLNSSQILEDFNNGKDLTTLLGCDFMCSSQSITSTARPDTDLTLCIVAYQMIREQNTKGVDMFEIGIQLWNGFVKGEEGSGCKVQTKLLHSVLEYISE